MDALYHYWTIVISNYVDLHYSIMILMVTDLIWKINGYGYVYEPRFSCKGNFMVYLATVARARRAFPELSALCPHSIGGKEPGCLRARYDWLRTPSLAVLIGHHSQASSPIGARVFPWLR